MKSETKVGFALIVVLITAFGLVVYQKQAKQQELIAQLAELDQHKEDNAQDGSDDEEKSPAKLTSGIEEDDNPVELSADPFADEKEIVQNSTGKPEPKTLPTSFRDQEKSPASLIPIDINEVKEKEQTFDPFAEPESPSQEVASNTVKEQRPAQLNGSLGLQEEEAVVKNDSNNPFGDEPEIKKEMPAEQLPEQDPFDDPSDSTPQNDPPKDVFEEPIKKEVVKEQNTPLPESLPVETAEDDPFKKPKESFPPKEESPFDDSPTDEIPTKVVEKETSPFEDDDPFSPDAEQTPKREVIETQPNGNQADKVYVVEQNDNYWNISKTVYGKGGYFRALARYNLSRIRNPRKLKSGMKVLVPTIAQLKAQFPKDCPQSASVTPTEVGFRLSNSGDPTYIVGGGDTLGSIAQGHLGRASRWVQIYEMNRDAVKNPKKLKIGTVLQLPADASRVRLVHKNSMSR